MITATRTFPEACSSTSACRAGQVSAPVAVGTVVCLAFLGLPLIWSPVLSLWALWTTDALKSIGMIVPPVSLALILRVWRSLNWETEGSWWGLVVLLATTVLVRARGQMVMALMISPSWYLYFPPHSLVVFAYGVGIVLLFGGKRLTRAALFPLLFLLLVNPVPHVFNVYVDLPLQRVSAHVARSFALMLGQPLSPDKLRLMFTPEFGIFIAPGCNGIRGAATMGLIALVAGYLYRFRWWAHGLVVAGAILLGYLFNFARLCVLVLYYLLALRFPVLQDKARNADYFIGAALFFTGVYLLYAMILRLGAARRIELEKRELPKPLPYSRVDCGSFFARATAMALLVAVGWFGMSKALASPRSTAELLADDAAVGEFPHMLGEYRLARSWNENLVGGALLFHWAEYAPTGRGTRIAFGISPVLGSHDTLICHSARGEEPVWHGQETFRTVGGASVNFSGAFFNDGAVQFLEVTTICNGSHCGEYSSSHNHFGFVYSRPRAVTVANERAERPIPILLRAETTDTRMPAEVARKQLIEGMTAFLSRVDVNALTLPYRK